MQAQELHGGRVACMPVHLLLDPGCTFCQPLPVPCWSLAWCVGRTWLPAALTQATHHGPGLRNILIT